MELVIYNIEGKDTGRKIELKDEVFGIVPNDHAIYLDIKQYMANNRQGTHKAKEKSEVSGSTRKIKKQKGTGGARAGSIKSPLFKGGARMFGPRPRDYSFKLNKKVKLLARKSALAYKASTNNIVVVQDFTFEQAKTKNLVALKNNLNIADKKSLLVLVEPNKNIYLSSRNLPYSEVVSVSELNTYKVLNAATLVLAESSVKALQEIMIK